MENLAYQEERSNHKGEKFSVVPFPNTVVQPLQNHGSNSLSEIYQLISKEKRIQIIIPCNDDQSDQHTCHKLYSACYTWRPETTVFPNDSNFFINKIDRMKTPSIVVMLKIYAFQDEHL